MTLAHAGGLHARPAARAREAARGFDAKVEVRFEGRKAPIESVVGLLGLGAGEGATIELLGIGAQASEAVEAVAAELLRAAHGEVEETPARAKSPAPETIQRAPGQPLDPNTLAGVCAAPGIAVGKLVRWDDQDITPPEQATATSARKAMRSTARSQRSMRNSTNRAHRVAAWRSRRSGDFRRASRAARRSDARSTPRAT